MYIFKNTLRFFVSIVFVVVLSLFLQGREWSGGYKVKKARERKRDRVSQEEEDEDEDEHPPPNHPPYAVMIFLGQIGDFQHYNTLLERKAL